MDVTVSVSNEVYFPGSRMRLTQKIVFDVYYQLDFFMAQKNSCIIFLKKMKLNGKQK